MSKSEHILDVAENLFNRFGYSAVGVDLIRDEAQVSKTSMYRHFGSKNKLIEAVLNRRHQRFEDALGQAISLKQSTAEKLDAILNWHFAWFRDENFKGCMFMHALAEFKETDQMLASHAMQHKVWLKSLIFSTFPPGERQPEEKTEVIMAFLEGVIVRAEFGEISKDQELYRSGLRSLVSSDLVL